MALNIGENGIVFQRADGTLAILRPGRNGGAGTQIAVPPDLADACRLATGDVACGETQNHLEDTPPANPDADLECRPEWDAQFDEPTTPSGVPLPAGRFERPVTQQLVSIKTVNGLRDLPAFPNENPDGSANHRSVVAVNKDTAGEGPNRLDLPTDSETCVLGLADRPFPQTQRSRSERTPPDRWLELADGRHDTTGRTLDFAAPLGAGVCGLVYGPHGAGLTRTLQSVLNGVVKNAPDCVPLVLLLRPRAEEATEWRRRFPQADIVVGASAFSENAPEQTLQLCDLMLEAAQRQTELGRDVVLLVDSLTALWGTMLEAEEADAQREADTSLARRRMRTWVQKAGCFHGDPPLGGGLGGSLTLIGTVWHQAMDTEAEAEYDLHPHLRLLEHILPEAGWLVPLSDTLALHRIYPTINVKRCRSQDEERLLPAAIVETHLKARGGLPDGDPPACALRLQQALDASTDREGLLAALGR